MILTWRCTSEFAGRCGVTGSHSSARREDGDVHEGGARPGGGRDEDPTRRAAWRPGDIGRAASGTPPRRRPPRWTPPLPGGLQAPPPTECLVPAHPASGASIAIRLRLEPGHGPAQRAGCSSQAVRSSVQCGHGVSGHPRDPGAGPLPPPPVGWIKVTPNPLPSGWHHVKFHCVILPPVCRTFCQAFQMAESGVTPALQAPPPESQAHTPFQGLESGDCQRGQKGTTCMWSV